MECIVQQFLKSQPTNKGNYMNENNTLAPAEITKSNSPFHGLTYEEIYQKFIDGDFGPKWPDEGLQKGYTGTNKVDLVRRSFSFIKILQNDGAFDKTNWKGLDYGCGWGRLASAMLSKGDPDQLDLCDAWKITLNHLDHLGFENKIFEVPTLLDESSIPPRTYDFIFSFSVFTHLSPLSFQTNIPRLMDSLNDSGKLYITVRHNEFLDHKYADDADKYNVALMKDNIVFIDSGGDLNSEKLFGDTIITSEYLKNFGKVDYLGTPHSLQHIYALSRY